MLAFILLLAGAGYFAGAWHGRGRTVAAAASSDAKATQLYKSALFEWQTRSPAGLRYAVKDFEGAIARDPHYAMAYAGLADCYNLLREFTPMPPEIAYPRAKAAAERAIALDPSIAEAHAALGFDDFYWSRDEANARRQFETALKLDPDSADIHHWYATVLMTVRSFPQAVKEIDEAARLDPESTAILADKGLILVHQGKTAEGVAPLQRLEQTQPQFLSQLKHHIWPRSISRPAMIAPISRRSPSRRGYAETRGRSSWRKRRPMASRRVAMTGCSRPSFRHKNSSIKKASNPRISSP